LIGKLLEFVVDAWSLWTDHVTIPVLLLFGAGAVSGLRERESRRLAAALAATALFWMAAQRVIPYARVFLYGIPLCCVVAGAGLRKLWPGRLLAPSLATVLAAYYYAGYVWFPTPVEQIYRELASRTPRLLQQAGPRTAVYAAVPLSEPIRYAFLAAGRSRLQVLAPDPVLGTPPAFEGWDEIIVVRPVARNPKRGYWVDLDDPAFRPFSNSELIGQDRYVESLRLTRRPAKKTP
jgi:hypothetical protein